jgi:DNA-binding IscR family transcriptional regulator
MAELADESPGEWLSVSALARALGVDKAAVSRRVARLEAAGALSTRAGERGTKLINHDEFNLAVEMTKDAIRETNGRAASPYGGRSERQA